MTSITPNRRLAALSSHFPPSPTTSTSSKPTTTTSSTTTTLPQIPAHAPPSTSPRTPGKIIIITGANSPLGIGRATAHQFAANGARAIYLCDVVDEFLEMHVSEMSGLFPDVEVWARRFDAADGEAVGGVVDECLGRYGRLDVFFANAGVVGTVGKAFGDVGGEEFMRVLRVNVLSVFLAVREGSRGMMVVDSSDEDSEERGGWKKKRVPGGSIVATSSVAGLRSNAGATDYSASKAAVRSIVQTTAWQLRGTGIRVNAILPGLVETGMTSQMYEKARGRGTEGKIGQLNPTGRGGVADEVARVALFLASDEASYVNGQGWAVDGGLSAGHPVVPGKLA